MRKKKMHQSEKLKSSRFSLMRNKMRKMHANSLKPLNARNAQSVEKSTLSENQTKKK